MQKDLAFCFFCSSFPCPQILTRLSEARCRARGGMVLGGYRWRCRCGRTACTPRAAARSSGARRGRDRRAARGLSMLRRCASQYGRERLRDARLGASKAARHPYNAAQICLPCMRQPRSGSRSRARDRRRAGNTCTADAGAGKQILRPHPALPSVAHLRPARR